MGFGPVLIIIVLVTIYVCNILFPRRMWGLFKAWRFQDPDAVEPSGLVLWWIRVSSALGLILMGGVAVYAVIEHRQDERCAAVLAELRELHEKGGLSAVQRRAEELDLEVEDLTREPGERIMITEDGELFVTLFSLSSEGRCHT